MADWHVGCVSWTYPDWVGPFYAPGTPPGEFLSRYARVFGLVEVDSTFYGVPSPDVTARWARDTPEGFVFALKAPGTVAREPQAGEKEDDWEEFLLALEPLREAGRLGPVLLQFPPGFDQAGNLERLERFLADRIPAWMRLGVEFRHASWWNDRTYGLLGKERVALVWSVQPHARPPPRRTADFLYVRFLGDRALTRFDRIQRDERAAVEAWVEPVRREAEAARDVYLLASNHFMGFGPGTVEVVCDAFGLPRPELGKALRPAAQRGLGAFGP